jgi:hypothetical protein
MSQFCQDLTGIGQGIKKTRFGFLLEKQRDMNLVHSEGRTLKVARSIPKYSVQLYSWNEDNDIMGLEVMKPKHRERWRLHDKHKWDAQILCRNHQTLERIVLIQKYRVM